LKGSITPLKRYLIIQYHHMSKIHKVGDKVQYNKKEIVEILQIQGKYCLILFSSGTKICTTLSTFDN
jgi:hypothetical protein